MCIRFIDQTGFFRQRGLDRQNPYSAREEFCRKNGWADHQMTPAALQDWRKRLGLTAKAAAEQLGLSQNGYAAYDAWMGGHGEPIGRGTAATALYRNPRPIPKHVELACCEPRAPRNRWTVYLEQVK